MHICIQWDTISIPEKVCWLIEIQKVSSVETCFHCFNLRIKLKKQFQGELTLGLRFRVFRIPHLQKDWSVFEKYSEGRYTGRDSRHLTQAWNRAVFITMCIKWLETLLRQKLTSTQMPSMTGWHGKQRGCFLGQRQAGLWGLKASVSCPEAQNLITCCQLAHSPGWGLVFYPLMINPRPSGPPMSHGPHLMRTFQSHHEQQWNETILCSAPC